MLTGDHLKLNWKHPGPRRKIVPVAVIAVFAT